MPFEKKSNNYRFFKPYFVVRLVVFFLHVGLFVFGTTCWENLTSPETLTASMFLALFLENLVEELAARGIRYVLEFTRRLLVKLGKYWLLPIFLKVWQRLPSTFSDAVRTLAPTVVSTNDGETNR